MIIRTMTSRDGQAAIRLVQELAREEGEVSLVTPDYVGTYLAQPGSRALVAEMDGRVIGLLSYSLRPDLYHAGPVAFIELLVVDAACRGQGVGSALMKDLLGKLSEQHCVELSVATSVANRRAQRFYQRHGLVEETMLLEQHF